MLDAVPVEEGLKVAEDVNELVGVLELLGVPAVLDVREGNAPTEGLSLAVIVTVEVIDAVSDCVCEEVLVPDTDGVAVGVLEGVSLGVELASRELVDVTDALALYEIDAVGEAEIDCEGLRVDEDVSLEVRVGDAVAVGDVVEDDVGVWEILVELESEFVLEREKKRGSVFVCDNVALEVEVRVGEGLTELVGVGD